MPDRLIPFAGILMAVIAVLALYATAEAIHHAGLNPFSPASDAPPASAQHATVSEASRGMGSGS